MASETYTVDQIKAAFWKVFHKSGEHFFPYDDDEVAADRATQSTFDELLESMGAPQEFPTDAMIKAGMDAANEFPSKGPWLGQDGRLSAIYRAMRRAL